MNVTEHDYQIVEFLDKYKIASIKTISYFCFNNHNYAQKRIKFLYEKKMVKRIETNSGQYAYYTKTIKQVSHSLLVTEFYREFSKVYKVLEFKVEPQYENIRPNASFVYIDKGIERIGMLEVEISHNTLDIEKYENFIKSGKHENAWGGIPVAYVVGNPIRKKSNVLEFKEFKIK